MSLLEINKRYSKLAEDTCCLSCGGAVDFAAPKEGETCLDLGSGRGTDVLRMAESVGETGFVYGVDISDGMINKARKNAEKLRINNVKFLRNDLEKLEIKDYTIDLVISNCTINHSKDKLSVWKEIYRVLKPGGRFVVSDIYSIQEVPVEYKNDPVAISECWAGASTRDKYIETLKKAGFPSITIIEESKPYSKGKIEVASFTISGKKEKSKCCCNG